jgi:hypothetical protein
MNNPGSSNLTLPPALAGMMGMSSPAAPAGLASGMTGQQGFAPSYQMGGMIGSGGMPEPTTMPAAGGMPSPGGAGLAAPGQMPQGSMSPQMLEMQINQFATQHPQELAQIQQAIMQSLQSGELTQQELNMVVQLATVAAQNPEMYPNIRSFAIQNGIATEQDLPQQYDQGLVFVLLLAARAIQSGGGEQGAPQGGPPAMGAPQAGAIPSMAKGGMTPDSKRSDGSVLINAHEGEFVIPANVVKMKGKEFFDSLVEKYRDVQ